LNFFTSGLHNNVPNYLNSKLRKDSLNFVTQSFQADLISLFFFWIL